MNLSNLTYEQANYMLRQGRATLEDARAYVEAWNRVKVSTCATVAMCTETICGQDFRVPVILVIDLPD